jgi:hypothetical protein
MVPLSSLWVPILVSAVFVFVASSIIHMVLGYHRNDFAPLPQEGQVLDALRSFNIPPGEYMAPRAASMADMKSPEFLEKMKRGPVVAATFFPLGQWSMGPLLFQWFLFSVLISIFAAYVAGRTLASGTAYIEVMRIAGTVAFAGYSLAYIPASIWYRRKWSTTFKNLFDGLVYGLLTGGTFGWLWPAM